MACLDVEQRRLSVCMNGTLCDFLHLGIVIGRLPMPARASGRVRALK